MKKQLLSFSLASVLALQAAVTPLYAQESSSESSSSIESVSTEVSSEQASSQQDSQKPSLQEVLQSQSPFTLRITVGGNVVQEMPFDTAKDGVKLVEFLQTGTVYVRTATQVLAIASNQLEVLDDTLVEAKATVVTPKLYLHEGTVSKSGIVEEDASSTVLQTFDYDSEVFQQEYIKKPSKIKPVLTLEGHDYYGSDMYLITEDGTEYTLTDNIEIGEDVSISPNLYNYHMNIVKKSDKLPLTASESSSVASSSSTESQASNESSTTSQSNAATSESSSTSEATSNASSEQSSMKSESTSSQSNAAKKDGKDLPTTGESNWIQPVGIGVLALGIIGFFLAKRKKDNE